MEDDDSSSSSDQEGWTLQNDSNGLQAAASQLAAMEASGNFLNYNFPTPDFSLPFLAGADPINLSCVPEVACAEAAPRGQEEMVQEEGASTSDSPKKSSAARFREKKLYLCTERPYRVFKRRKNKLGQVFTKVVAFLGPVCGKAGCERGQKVYHCRKLLEEDRERMFLDFWAPERSREDRVRYVNALIDIAAVNRRTSDNVDSIMRKVNYKYHAWRGTQRLQVCRTTLLNILGLKSQTVRHWVDLDPEQVRQRDMLAALPPPKERAPRNLKLSKEFASVFLNSLHTTPAQDNTNKHVLDPQFTHIHDVYKLYRDAVVAQANPQITVCCRRIFDKLFLEKQLAIAVPFRSITYLEDGSIQVDGPHMVATNEPSEHTVEASAVKAWQSLAVSPAAVDSLSEDVMKNMRRSMQRWKTPTSRCMEVLVDRASQPVRVLQRMKNNRGQLLTRVLRSLLPGCNSPVCKTAKSRQCQELTETQREDIFCEFWTRHQTLDERKRAVVEMVTIEPVARRTSTVHDHSARNVNYGYYLVTLEGQRLQVCQGQFLSTLGLKGKTVHAWLSADPRAAEVRELVSQSSQRPRTGKTGPISAESRSQLLTFLASLPRDPQHSLKLTRPYTGPMSLFNAYLAYCAKEALTSGQPCPTVLSRSTVLKITRESNLIFAEKLVAESKEPEQENEEATTEDPRHVEKPAEPTEVRRSSRERRPVERSGEFTYMSGAEEEEDDEEEEELDDDGVDDSVDAGVMQNCLELVYGDGGQDTSTQAAGLSLPSPTGGSDSHQLSPPCSCSPAVRPGDDTQCRQFREGVRQRLLAHFWSGYLTPAMQRAYVCNLVDVKMGRVNYHLVLEGNRLRVCQTMFLGTLCVEHRAVQDWVLPPPPSTTSPLLAQRTVLSHRPASRGASRQSTAARQGSPRGRPRKSHEQEGGSVGENHTMWLPEYPSSPEEQMEEDIEDVERNPLEDNFSRQDLIQMQEEARSVQYGVSSVPVTSIKLEHQDSVERMDEGHCNGRESLS